MKMNCFRIILGLGVLLCHISCSPEREEQIDSSQTICDYQADLSRAINNNDAKQVAYLLQQGASATTKLPEGIFPLEAALNYSKKDEKTFIKEYIDINILTSLLAAGADPNYPLSDGKSPLHYCLRNMRVHSKYAEKLIQGGANINVRDEENGNTPLISTAANVNSGERLIHQLLCAGADVFARNNKGQSAWDVLREKLSNEDESPPTDTQLAENEEGRLLLAYGVDMLIDSNSTALMLAIMEGNVNAVDNLLAAKVPLDTRGKRDNTALMLAAARGHNDIVQKLIDAGAVVNAVNAEGYTALSLAAMFGHCNTVRILAQAGSNLNVRDYSTGSTPLIQAVYWKIDVMQQLLIELGADVNVVDNRGCTALMNAVWSGNVSSVKLLVNHGANVNCGKQLGCPSAVHYALMLPNANDAEILRILIEHGANISEPYTDGDSVLMQACYWGMLECCRLLIGNGVSVNLANKAGETALMKSWKPEVIQLLLNEGADATARDKFGNTPLMHYTHAIEKKNAKEVVSLLMLAECDLEATEYSLRNYNALLLAVQEDNIECATALIRSGANVNFHSGGTLDKYPITIAAERNHSDMVRMLLEQGANPNAADNVDGLQAIHYAAKNGNIEMLESLIQYGAKADSIAEGSLTPLVLAAGEGHTDMVKKLLSLGVSPNQGKNFIGNSALAAACLSGNLSVVKALLEAGADINSSNKQGENAYDIAHNHEKEDILSILQSYGACATPPSDSPLTSEPPLCRAAENNDTVLLLHILSKKRGDIDWNETNSKGRTPLMLAKEAWYTAIMLEAGADPNFSSPKDGYSPLMCAIINKSILNAEFLLGKGADPNHLAHNGDTALILACDTHSSPGMVELLLKYGAKVEDASRLLRLLALSNRADDLQLVLQHVKEVDIPDKDGCTPLMCACLAGYLECVDVLLKAGANPLVKDNRGKTPFSYALINPVPELIHRIYHAEIEARKKMD